MADRRVVVVGTTSDYIDIVNRRFEGRAVFLTEPAERSKAVEPSPDETSEVLCDLTRPEEALSALRRHLNRFHLTPSGIACYDCESMALASYLGSALGLPYPSSQAIATSRNKLLSKKLWREAGLPCPQFELVHKEADTVAFMNHLGRPVVLKPLTGSGSELIFSCSNIMECRNAFGMIQSGLASHPNVRMYDSGARISTGIDPRKVFAAEELVEGIEYSCDFILERGNAELIRIARKIRAVGQSFGTTLAYILPAEFPAEIDTNKFKEQMGKAARAFGLERSICMVDLIVRGNEALMLEMTPRPGGDCLPFLIRQSCGLDIIGAALDFAEGYSVKVPEPSAWKKLVGLRLFAAQEGVINYMDMSLLQRDPRVKEVNLKRRAGHRVILPPKDYDSRVLGHVIFEPSRWDNVVEECMELSGKFKPNMDTTSCKTTNII